MLDHGDLEAIDEIALIKEFNHQMEMESSNNRAGVSSVEPSSIRPGQDAAINNETEERIIRYCKVI